MLRVVSDVQPAKRLRRGETLSQDEDMPQEPEQSLAEGAAQLWAHYRAEGTSPDDALGLMMELLIGAVEGFQMEFTQGELDVDVRWKVIALAEMLGAMRDSYMAARAGVPPGMGGMVAIRISAEQAAEMMAQDEGLGPAEFLRRILQDGPLFRASEDGE